MAGCPLQGAAVAGAQQRAVAGCVRRCQGAQDAARLPGHGLAVVQQGNVRAEQRKQVLAGKRVVGAAQNQGVNLPIFSAKLAYGAYVVCAKRYRFVSIFALDGIGQTIAGLADKIGLAVQGFEQRAKFGAAQRATGRHHADAPGLAVGQCRFERRLHADDGQAWVLLAQHVNGGGGGGVAGHDQRLDAVLSAQVAGDGARTLDHVGVVTLAIGGVAAVRQVNKIFMGQLGAQGAQHT